MFTVAQLAVERRLAAIASVQCARAGIAGLLGSSLAPPFAFLVCGIDLRCGEGGGSMVAYQLHAGVVAR